MQILTGLNPQQQQAVTATFPQVLVLAGPGSGKTRVLTSRIAYLIGTLGVRPYNILAVTFTNKAAREMEKRVERLLGAQTQGLTLGTFHATCARLLRREAERLPVTSDFTIFDSDDQEALVRRIIKELQLPDKQFRPSGVHAVISRAKNDQLTPEDFPIQTWRDEAIKRVYLRYQELLVACNAVDFDDLLLYTARLLEEHPDVRTRYARRYEHVLVDEFQDTNLAQYNLLRNLASYHKNIFVVGDEDQSIYRWRGADYRNIQRFAEDYPAAQKILLEQNYRSTQKVLDVARAVIDPNPFRTPKHLFTERGEGDLIALYEAGDDYSEAAFVVDTIAQQLGARRARGGDFAVMYRTNAQSRLLEEAFLKAGMPYRLVGAQRFYGRREVKDIIAYLRLVQNPADEISLNRAINTPPRGIGDKTMLTLQLTAQRRNRSAGDLLIEIGRNADSPIYKELGRSALVLASFGELLADWVSLRETLPLPQLFDRIVADADYRAYIDDQSEEGSDRWGNVEELRRIAFEYEERGLPAFLENLALVSDQDTLPEASDAPTLLTLHAAKGLEFPQVFIIGLDDGLLPHSRAFDEPEEMAEERRLLYVGMTRARDKLYLVRADQRGSYGGAEATNPSRFLKDIPEHLLEIRRRSGRRITYANGSASRSDALWGSVTRTPPLQQSAPIIQARYQPNMRVRHAVWGEGLVVMSKVLNGEETVDIFFDSVGFKRVDAALAKLDIISQ